MPCPAPGQPDAVITTAPTMSSLPIASPPWQPTLRPAAQALVRPLPEPPMGGNRVALLEGTGAAAMAQAVESAVDHVNLDAALLEPDPEPLVHRLAARARAGVCVNLLVDARSGLLPGSDAHAQLRDAGVNLAERGPVARRLMVVDGTTAFVGDALPAQLALLLRIDGPAVQRLQRLFVGHWQRRAQATMRPARLFPPPVVAGAQVVAVADREGAATTLAGALDAARERVVCGTGGLVPSRRLVQAMAIAAQRGVQVDLLAPGATDAPRLRQAARARYGPLLAAGVRVHERAGPAPHAEACVIDGLWASLGAAPRDLADFRDAGRADLAVIDENFATRMESLLRLQLALAVPVRRADWRPQPWWQRWPRILTGGF